MANLQLSESDGSLFVIVDPEYYEECNKLKWIIEGTTVKCRSKNITLQRYIWVNCMKKEVHPSNMVYHYKEDNRFDYTAKNITTCPKGGTEYMPQHSNIMKWWVQRKML
jgi:hypothetical protein